MTVIASACAGSRSPDTDETTSSAPAAVPGAKPTASLTNSTWFCSLVTNFAKASAAEGFSVVAETLTPCTNSGGMPGRAVAVV